MKKNFLSFVLGTMLFSAPAFATDLYLIGDATSAGWTIESAVQMYDTVTPNVFTWTGDLKIGELKFLTQKDAWIPSYGPVTIDEEMVTGDVDLLLRDKDEEGTDHKFKVTACGWYTLTIDLTDAEKPSLNVSVFYPSTMYLIGDAVGGWDWDNNSQEMTSIEEGVFGWTGSLSEGEFKFFEIKYDFTSTSYGATIDSTAVTIPGEYVLEKLGSDDKKFIATAGSAKITVDLKQMKLILEQNSTSLIDVTEKDNAVMIFDMTGSPRAHMEKGGIYIIKQGSKTTKVVSQ